MAQMFQRFKGHGILRFEGFGEWLHVDHSAQIWWETILNNPYCFILAVWLDHWLDYVWEQQEEWYGEPLCNES